MQGHELFSLDRLKGSLASWSDADEIARAYAQSLVFVDYLVHAHGEEVLRLMVAGCAQGQRAGGSVRAARECRWSSPMERW